MKNIFILLLSVALFTFACKDKENDPIIDDSGKSKTELLIKKKWLLDSGIFSPSITIEILGQQVTFKNINEVSEPCQNDNTIMFDSAKTITLDEGALKCNPNDPQSLKDGEWKFIDNETKIMITNSEYFGRLGKDTTIATITKLTDTELFFTAEASIDLPTGTQNTQLKAYFRKK